MNSRVRTVLTLLVGLCVVKISVPSGVVSTVHAFNNWNIINASSACQGTNKTSAQSMTFGKGWVFNTSPTLARSVVCTYFRDAHNYSTLSFSQDVRMSARFYVGPGDTVSCTWYVKNAVGGTVDSAFDSFFNTTQFYLIGTINSGWLDETAQVGTEYFLSSVCSIASESYLLSMTTQQDDAQPALN